LEHAHDALEIYLHRTQTRSNDYFYYRLADEAEPAATQVVYDEAESEDTIELLDGNVELDVDVDECDVDC
jgi:hypothetical protein